MLVRIVCLVAIIFNCSALVAATTPAAITPVSKQKTVLITGGVTGIGREIALAFQKEGWNVWVTSRNPEQRDTLPGVTVRPVDLTNQQQVNQLMHDIKTKTGSLNVLVNNAGYGILGPTETVSVAQARDLMDINVIGPFITMQAALPLMRANHGGHIINISSTSGLRALPGLGLYAASKMALEGLSEALAAETAQWNIQVSIVEPGTVKNEWVTNALTADKINDFPGYKTFTNNLKASLQNKAYDIGQDPKEVAQVTVQIANTPKPDLRYQTNNSVAALANEILVDPTGNKMRDKGIEYGRDLYAIR